MHRPGGDRSVPAGARAYRPLLLYGAVTALLTGFFLTFSLLPRAYELREGEVSPVNLRANHKLSYVSQSRTRLERERAAAGVAPVQEINVAVVDQQRRALTAFLQSISGVRTAPSLTPEQRLDQVARMGDPPLGEERARWLVMLSDSSWFSVATEAQRLRQDVMKDRISDSRLPEVIRELPVRSSDQLSEADRELAVDLASRFIRPNLVTNNELTASLRRQAADTVAPVQINVEEGEVVLREGQVVTADDLETLEMLGLRTQSVDWRSVAAGFMLATVAVAPVFGYIAIFQPRLMQRERVLWLIGLLIIITVLAAKMVLPGRPLWVYVFPLPAVAMLVTTLIDGRLAILMSTVLAVLVSYVAGGSLELAAMFTLGGVVASAGSARQERIHAYFITGLAVALTHAAVVAVFRLPTLLEDPRMAAIILGECLVNGILSPSLTVGTVSLLGRLFGITTTMQLLELANPTQPLLRRLLVEAPGTYHHSIMVGNLAERAAEEVGADSLLVRVGAYYHDIGKLQRPYFFTENQATGANAHEGLRPEGSARIIAAHVPDGLALGAKHGLPKAVLDMIPQHHGTRMVSFFYQQAAELSATPPDPKQFTYQGPRPQSKEAAILMMADGVEAAARSLKQPTPQAISELVERLIMQRLSEGQLDDSDLTLRDIQRIKGVFCSLLAGLYHPRIEYPAPAPGPAQTPANVEQPAV